MSNDGRGAHYETKSLVFTLVFNSIVFFNLILVVAQVVQEQQQLELMLNVDHQTCIPHVIPSAHRAVFSWWDRIFASARRSAAETLANCD